MSNDRRTYEEHLAALYRHYGPNLKEQPTADNILDQVAYPGADISYDQREELIKQCFNALEAYFERYGSDALNIVTFEKMENFLFWVIGLPEEIQAGVLRNILKTFEFPTHDKRGNIPPSLASMIEKLGYLLD